MSEKEDGFVLAYCGLVCSDCGMYKKGRCQGCHSDGPMFKNCPVKKCAVEREYTTCADCGDFADLKACKKLHNWISRFFGLIFRTNRIGNLNRIRDVGVDTFKAEVCQE
ncbi:MAG: DUF3795 domain-containing protein [Phycisphaerales bacterium]|nr:MAG: DUF3795 domain-containing protein [Phycisphaerales bacterium]